MQEKVAIIGSGNVAYHLAGVFYTKGLLSRLIVRERHKGEALVRSIGAENTEVSTDFDQQKAPADLVVAAVPDQALHEVFSTYRFAPGTILAHASGAQSIDLLAEKGIPAYGVFYPFQTFTKEKEVDFARIPILVEGSNEAVTEKLESIARKISPQVYRETSAQRLKIHLAAVFACNFSNNLYRIAGKLLQGTGLELNQLSHLIRETTEKALELTPEKAQTGPAIRKDEAVLRKHLDLLREDADLKRLYELHSKLIQQ